MKCQKCNKPNHTDHHGTCRQTLKSKLEG